MDFMNLANMATQDSAYFGQASGAQLEELQKALTTGTPGISADGTYISPATDAGALRVESLESTLKTTTFRMEHIKFWRALAKKRAFSTVEEYNRLTSYGSDTSAFFDEGGLPKAEDALYERKFGIVKFLGVTKVVTHPLLLVRTAHGDVMARETINGTMWLLEKLERSLFFGNDIINRRQFPGIAAQIIPGSSLDSVTTDLGGTTNLYGNDGAPAQNVIDCKGGPLTEELLELGSQIVADAYGRMQVLFTGTRALSDLAKTFFPKERIHLPAPTDGVAGTPLTHFASQNGYIRLEPDVFIRPGGFAKTAGDDGCPNVPVTPTIDAAASVGPTTGSEMEAGTYWYAVSSVGAGGDESAAVPITLSRVTAAGEGNLVKWFPPAGGGNPTVSFRIYRGTGVAPALAGVGAGQLVTEVPNLFPSNPGAAYMTFRDRNRFRPGTSMAFGLYMDAEQGMSFKQLAPLMKINLATLSAAVRFMILLYGVPEVYAPSKQIIYKNIGPLST